MQEAYENNRKLREKQDAQSGGKESRAKNEY